MKKRKPEEVLEDYLDERTIPDDPELASLSRVADRLERGLKVDAPEARRERALFIQGVAARKPGFPWARLMVPITAASILVAFVAIGREAGPGDALYGVRKALSKVGVAEDPERSARKELDKAEDRIGRAEAMQEAGDFEGAQTTLDEGRAFLVEAAALLEDTSGEVAEEQRDRLEDLRDDVNDLQEEIDDGEDLEERREEARERREEQAEEAEDRLEEQREDNSGKGGGDDDDGDDNSGKGGGDDDSSDDSSGSGSGGSGGDDSGGDDSGGDSSGSGSGGDSGSDDS